MMMNAEMSFTDDKFSNVTSDADQKNETGDTDQGSMVVRTVKTNNVIDNGDNGQIQEESKKMYNQEPINNCTRCRFYQDRLKAAEHRLRKLEKLKIFCHKEIKTLREDLSRAKNLIVQQSVKLEQTIPSEGPPWLVPSDENAVMKPNVDYFTFRTFDKDSSLPLGNPPSSSFGKTCIGCQQQKSSKILTSTRTRTRTREGRNYKVGFVVPQSLTKRDTGPNFSSIQPRSKSAPSPKTYLDMHRLRKLRNEKLNHQDTVPVSQNRNSTNFQNVTTRVINIRSKSLPRNSKLNIVISRTSNNNDDENSKIQKKMSAKRSNVEILAIAVASREGLIREIAHSIRKAKRILHFRFDMLIASDFDMEDFHFLLTSHRRFIRWLHNYINYSRALLGRFDEQHLIGCWTRGKRKKMTNTTTTTSTSTIIDKSNKLTPDLRFACTQTLETRLFVKNPGKSLAIQTVPPQVHHFEQNFNNNNCFETMLQSHIAAAIFDTNNNNNNQEFAFKSKRNLSKSRGVDEEKHHIAVTTTTNNEVQDQGTCTEIGEEESKKDIGTGVEYVENGQGSNELLQFKRNVALQYISSTTSHNVEEEKISIPQKETWSTIHCPPVICNNVAGNCAANFHNIENGRSEETNSMDELVKTCHTIANPLTVKGDSLNITRQSVTDSVQSVQVEQLWFTSEDLPVKINSSILNQNTDFNVYKPLYQVDHEDSNCINKINCSKQELVDEGHHGDKNEQQHADTIQNTEKFSEELDNEKFISNDPFYSTKFQDPPRTHYYQPLNPDVREQPVEALIESTNNDQNPTKSYIVASSRASNSENSLRDRRLSNPGRPSPLDLLEEHHVREAEKFYNHRGNSHLRSLEPDKFFSTFKNPSNNEISDDLCHPKSRKRRTSSSTRSKSPLLRLPTSTDYKCMEKYFENNVKKYKQILSNPEEANLPKFPTAAQVVLNILNEQTGEGKNAGKKEENNEKYSSKNNHINDDQKMRHSTHPHDDDKSKELDDFDSFIHDTRNLLKEQISEMCHLQFRGSVYQPVDSKKMEKTEAQFSNINNNNHISLKEFLELTSKDRTGTNFSSMEELKNKKSRPQFIFQDFKRSRQEKNHITASLPSSKSSSPAGKEMEDQVSFKNVEEKEGESSSHHHQKSSLVTLSRLPVPSRPPPPPSPKMMVDNNNNNAEFLKKDKQEPCNTCPGIAEVQIPASLNSDNKASLANKLAKFSDTVSKGRSFIPVKTKTRPKEDCPVGVSAKNEGITGKILYQTSVKRLEKGLVINYSNSKSLNKEKASSFSSPSSATTKNSCRRQPESSSRPRCRDTIRAKSPPHKVLTKQWAFCKSNDKEVSGGDG